MKALIFQGPGKIALKTIPKPKLLTAKDAIVKVSKTTICGTDLHIIKGHVPESIPANRQTKNTVLQEKGLILGHEGIGKVVEVGDQVSKFKINDKVIISCTTSCGECYYCKKNLQSLCNDGGWILGHNIDGTRLTMSEFHTQTTRCIKCRKMFLKKVCLCFRTCCLPVTKLDP